MFRVFQNLFHWKTFVYEFHKKCDVKTTDKNMQQLLRYVQEILKS
jgi:hypothetical protein